MPAPCRLGRAPSRTKVPGDHRPGRSLIAMLALAGLGLLAGSTARASALHRIDVRARHDHSGADTVDGGIPCRASNSAIRPSSCIASTARSKSRSKAVSPGVTAMA